MITLGETSMPIPRADFQGDTDDASAPCVEDPIEKHRVMPQIHRNRCQRIFAITQAVNSLNNTDKIYLRKSTIAHPPTASQGHVARAAEETSGARKGAHQTARSRVR
jgi:hypothetical protein